MINYKVLGTIQEMNVSDVAMNAFHLLEHFFYCLILLLELGRCFTVQVFVLILANKT